MAILLHLYLVSNCDNNRTSWMNNSNPKVVEIKSQVIKFQQFVKRQRRLISGVWFIQTLHSMSRSVIIKHIHKNSVTCLRHSECKIPLDCDTGKIPLDCDTGPVCDVSECPRLTEAESPCPGLLSMPRLPGLTSFTSRHWGGFRPHRDRVAVEVYFIFIRVVIGNKYCEQQGELEVGRNHFWHWEIMEPRHSHGTVFSLTYQAISHVCEI